MPAFARSPHGLTDEELREKERRERLARERAEAEALAAANVDTFVELQEPTPPVTRKPRPVATVREYVPVDKPVAQATADPVTTQPGSAGGSKRMPSTPSFISGARNIDTSPLNFTPETFADLPEDLASRGVPVEAFEIAAMESQKSQAMHKQASQNITPERSFEIDYRQQSEIENRLTPMRFGGVSAEENRIYGRPDLNLAQAQQMSRDSRAARAQRYIDLPENINAAESVRQNSGSIIFEAAKQGLAAVQALDPELVKQYWANGVQSGLNEVLANVTGAKEALATLYMMMPEGGVYHGAGKNMMISAQEERQIQDAFRDQMAKGGYDPQGGEANELYQIIQAVGGSALVSASTAALAMTAGLPIALSAMGAQVFNTTLYQNLQAAEKGEMSQGRALEGAFVTTFLEIGTELPMLSFLKKIANVKGKGAAGNLISNMIKAAGIEAVAEGFNEAASMTYEAMRNGATFTDEQIANNLIVAMGAGGTGGSMLGGVTTSVAGLTKLGIKTFGKTDPTFMGIKEGLTNPNATIGQQNDAETARNLLIAKLKKIDSKAKIVTGLHIGTAANGELTHDVGKVNESGVAEIYIDDILMLSRNNNQAMKNLEMAARHEGGHVLLKGENAIRDAFFENHKKEILEWLGGSTEYEMLHTMLNTPSVTNTPLALQRLATEEFIMGAGEKDIKLTDNVKLAIFKFARSMGVNVSADTNARLLLDGLVKGDIEALRAQAESGGLIDKTRRDVLKAGAAVGAGLALEPGGMLPDVATAPVDAVAPQFAGGIMRPSAFPEMEGVLRAGAADALPSTGLVSDVASRAIPEEAYDFEADQEIARQEQADLQAKLDEYEAKDKVPQTWRTLETSELQTLAEANRAKDNPIWQAQFKELESRKAADEVAATEVEEFETIGLEEARLETQKQIDTFNQQLDDFEVSVDESYGGRFSKKVNITRRDTNDDWQKRFQPKLEGQELELGKLVHRLNNATHMKGRASIGLEAEPLDRAGFRAIMTDLMNGETESARAFLEEQTIVLEQYKKAKKDLAKEVAAEKYAQRVGKDRSAVAPRRAKGTVSELEGIMTPALAKREIDAQLEAGDIDQAAYDTKLERIQEIQKTVKGSGTSTQQKRKLLTEAAIGAKKIGRVPLDEMEREGFIGKREPNIPVEETKAPRSKAEIAKDNQAAYEKARAAGKVKVIPPKEGVAEEAKAAFDKGVTKKSTDASWNLPSESMFESRDYDAGEFTTEQGETLGEGFTGIEAKSTKLKVPSRKGSIEIIPSETGVKYIQKIPGQADQEVTSSEASFNEKKESGYFADYAVSYRVSKGFKNAFKNPESALYKWAKSNPEYDEGKYWPTDDSVLVSAWAEGFAKPEGYQALENAAAADGVTIPNELSRAEGERMSPDDPLVNRAISRAKDLNAEYEPVFGKKAFAPDHVVEMLEYRLFGEGTRSYPRGVHTANNIATIPTKVHDAINDWPKAAKTPAERLRRKNSENKIPELLKDTDFLNSKDKYEGVEKFLREAKGISKVVDKYGKPDAAAQEAILLNATADLLGIEKDIDGTGSRPWNTKDAKGVSTFTGTLTRESEGIAQATQDAFGRFSRKLKNEDPADTQKITADFTSNTLRTLAQYVFGAPVKRITDFNKLSALGVGEQGNIPMATTIGNLIQRSLSSQARPEGMEQGTDLVQETSLRTGEFYSRLFKVFAGVTNNGGLIPPAVNAQIVDYIAGKPVEFANKKTEAAAKELKSFMEDMYKYAKDRTAGLKTPLDLRGAGDSVLPRVWNIDYIATRGGKRKFLEAVANKFTDPKGKLVFEDANITPEDLYAVVVNSGGFVQGEWTNIKADQTTSKKEIEKDQLIQEYLDSLSTEELAESGLLVDDLQSVIPRFVQKAVERTEYSAVFGVNDELLRGMVQTGVDQIKAHNEAVMKMEEGGPNNLIDDKAFQKAVWDMSKILRNKFGYDMADMPTRKWLQRIANVEVVAKLPLVTLASLPEFFTPMLKGDVRPDKFATDFVMASAWAGYKGMNGVSKLLFNKHLPAMLKHSSDIEGLGIISDIQLLREMGIADIQAMGDSVATRYSNPNFARGGIRATTRGTVGGKIPKPVRAVFNMQTYMQATMLVTLTEMQQFMALRNYQRHVSTRIKAINESKGKKLKGKRAANRIKQYKQDILDYGLTEDIDLSTPEGEAAFNAGALRFIDQVITRPNDATTAKIFKNPLTAPLVLFKRFLTTYGNTLLTSVGTDFATKVDNVERAKQVGKLTVAAASMYGAVIFADIIRGAIKGDLDEEDFNIKPEDWKTFLRRIDRMGVLSAPGSAAANLTFPSKAWYGDTGTNRMVRELTGPFGSDMAGTLDFIMSKKGEKDLRRLLGQVAPISRSVLPKQERKKKKTTKSLREKKRESKRAYAY